MKNFNDILNSLKKTFSYGPRLRPARDWFVMLGVAFALLVLGVVWNIFLFNQFENGKGVAAPVAAPAQQGVGDSITQIQAIFQQRATEQLNYQNTYRFVDPSLPGS